MTNGRENKLQKAVCSFPQRIFDNTGKIEC